MTTFDARERAFEELYHHDQDLQFRVECRRNRLLASWAAEVMGLDAEATRDYAEDVVRGCVTVPCHAHDRILADLQAHNAEVSDHRLRRKMDELMAVARRQVMAEVRA